MDRTDLDNRFTYHAPHGDQAQRYVALRAKAKELAELILNYVPASREQSLAITNLEQAVMWANAGIARNEDEAHPQATLPQSEDRQAEAGPGSGAPAGMASSYK